MKKILFLLGLVLVVSLVSCAPVQQPRSVTVESGDTTDDVMTTPDEEPETEDEVDTTEEETELDTSDVEPTVSREELDQLKEDIEGMEFEDLGGLSE